MSTKLTTIASLQNLIRAQLHEYINIFLVLEHPLNLHNVFVGKRTMNFDLRKQLRTVNFCRAIHKDVCIIMMGYLLLGALTLERRLRDDFCRQLALVIHVRYFVALSESTFPKHPPARISPGNCRTSNGLDLLLDDG